MLKSANNLSISFSKLCSGFTDVKKCKSKKFRLVFLFEMTKLNFVPYEVDVEVGSILFKINTIDFVTL